MVAKSLLFLLGAASASAQQHVLGGGSCLSSAPSACCPPGSKNEATTVIDGVDFKYTCGHYPSKTKAPGHTVKTALECAALCGSDPTCKAASWYTGTVYLALGNCFLVKEDFSHVEHRDYMVLSKYTPGDGTTAPPVNPPACEHEKQLYQELDQQCTSDKADLEAKERACVTEKDEISGRKKQCREAEKQCHEDKAQLIIDKSECELREQALILANSTQEDLIQDLRSQIAAFQSNTSTPAPDDWVVAEPGSTCKFDFSKPPVPEDDGCILIVGGIRYQLQYKTVRYRDKFPMKTIGDSMSFYDCAKEVIRQSTTITYGFVFWKQTPGQKEMGSCLMTSVGVPPPVPFPIDAISLVRIRVV